RSGRSARWSEPRRGSQTPTAVRRPRRRWPTRFGRSFAIPPSATGSPGGWPSWPGRGGPASRRGSNGASGSRRGGGSSRRAWQRFCQAVASTLPLILVFEDLQWAAPALLEFVEQLVDWSTGVPLLVLCTARPELYDRSQGWGGGKRASTTIGLSPLSAPETV